jgi:hypothetical protein
LLTRNQTVAKKAQTRFFFDAADLAQQTSN